MKKLAIILLLLISSVSAQIVSHNASQIKPGVFGELFGGGNYIFPNRLSIGANVFDAILYINGTGTTLRVGNNTNTHLFVNSTSGYVGIGTKNPDSPLSVYAPASDGYVASFFNTLNQHTIIGIDSPAGKNSAIDFYNSGSFVGALYSTSNSLRLYQGSSDVVTITNGNVGIGTTNPVNKLHIAGLTDGQGITIDELDWTKKVRIFFREGGDSRYGGIVGYDAGPDILYLNTIQNGTERQGIAIKRDSGNVGIGTTTPTQKLHVEGNTYVSGNVGIGTTTPAVKLDVQGGWVRIGDVNSNAIQFETQSGFHRITFKELRFWDWDTGGDMVTFNNSNVGIGTTSPDSTLHIIGGVCIESSDNNCSQASGTLKATTIYEGSNTLSSKYVSRSDWTTHDNYPSPCPAEQFVTAIGDTLTCSAPSITFSGARVRNSVNWWGQNFYLSWNTEDFDTDNYHSTTTNTERLTIPQAGYYAFGAFVGHIPGTGGGGGHWSIVKNRAQTLTAQRIFADTSTGVNIWQELSGMAYFNQGDYIEVYFGHGYQLTVLASGSLYLSNAPNAVASFWIYRIK